MAKYFITAQIMVFRSGKIKGGRHGVIDPAAAHAAQVIVFRRIGVEAGLAAGVFQFLDLAHPSQQVQVAVDRAQAYLRQSPPHKLVEFHRRWVGRDRLQFLENDLPLPRLAALAFPRVPRPLGRKRPDSRPQIQTGHNFAPWRSGRRRSASLLERFRE